MCNELIVDECGHKYWYKNDLLHRIDGPAVEWVNGFKQWYLNGELHREDGPAVEYINGCKRWFYHGEEFWPESLEDYLRIIAFKKHYIVKEL